ncbi:CYTH domain-containing protein [Lachnospiraceae bacterium XBB1006]|nr:CYTH domain-containing protein [Lachnospiraceae bacterium XBB1006]
MEIERKFLVTLNDIDLAQYDFHRLEQGYLCGNPVVRVRRENDDFYLTYKGKGLLCREEYNLPLTKEGYEHLIKKSDNNIITKCRYLIPYHSYTIELDVFENELSGLVIAEVEFPSAEEANAFVPPDWFVKDVTDDARYQNVNLICGLPQTDDV